jgi:predicted DsbA family dithiol-disulfide isomerase
MSAAGSPGADLGLDVDRFREDLRRHVGADRVAEDVDSAGSSGVAGTPTFFINGRRQYGAYDIDTLTGELRSILMGVVTFRACLC